MDHHSKKRSSFSGAFGFVIAAAASAVGLGNIWRFPYLAAKDGGGLFLFVYIILALTFGFSMLITEVAIGRKTKQSCLTAYGKLHKPSKWIGVFAALVPFIILPYYCVIGGWVLKYCVTFCVGAGESASAKDYFSNFITDIPQPLIFTAIFLGLTTFVVFRGVNKGIEASSKILMPLLLLIIIAVSLFSLTLKSSDGRTGLEGFKIYIIPSIKGMKLKDIFIVITDAMGQLFYSISVAMGIMVTYGSYFKDEDDLMKSVNRIEIFDTLVAFLAGVMIIPAVYVFLGKEGMAAGPGLMFEALPKVFSAMGKVGGIIGAVFFLMVLFAAVTSSVSIMEAVVASLIDHFHWSRKTATVIEFVISLIIAVIVCLGYNVLKFEVPLPNGAKAQILDIMDYLSNNILMPIVEIGTCILIGWIVKPDTVIGEATKNGEGFGRKLLYVVMIKFVAPVMLLTLLAVSLGLFG